MAPAHIAYLQAAATFLAAMIALFGQSFWSWVKRPRLRVELVNKKGELESETIQWLEPGPGGANVLRERTREARFYRLRVTNLYQASAVQDIQIVVDAIDRPLPNNEQFVTEYHGPIPLKWQHAPAFPQFRSVGTPAVADFLAVTEEGTLSVLTTIPPNKYKMEYALTTELWITVAARGRECDSPPARFRICWDGQWHAGADEMARHLTIDVREQ